MRSRGKNLGGVHHAQCRGSSIGIDLSLEDPIHGDAGNAVVVVEEPEPAHTCSREAEVCRGASRPAFRESPSRGPWIGPMNPSAGVAHGWIRILDAWGRATPASGHAEPIDRDRVAGRAGGAG